MISFRAGAVLAALSLAALLLPLPAAAADKKAKSIDELAKMYDSSGCKQCHEGVYNEWEQSLHARSIFGTGRTALTVKTTVEVGLMSWKYSGVKKPEDVQVKHVQVCFKCHLPQIAEAEDSVAKEIVKLAVKYGDKATPAEEKDKIEKKLSSINIGCTVCHQRNAIVHKWVDGFPQKNEVYGSKEGAHPAATHPSLKKSPIMSESILCGQCHGLGPNFELENPSQCGTLYGSYLWAYRAEGGQESCQECHMRKSKMGHNMQSYSDTAFGRSAVDFQVETLGYIWRDKSKMMPQALVKIDMTNRAGHSIPDG
jgi:hypothetical protein